jgi:hypothetical protein
MYECCGVVEQKKAPGGARRWNQEMQTFRGQSRSGPGSSSAPPLPADPNLGAVHFPVVVRGGLGVSAFSGLDGAFAVERSLVPGFGRSFMLSPLRIK